MMLSKKERRVDVGVMDRIFEKQFSALNRVSSRNLSHSKLITLSSLSV